MRQRTFVITSSDLSVWPSCRTIISNLLASYDSIKDRFDIEFMRIFPDGRNVHGLAQEIKQRKPSKIIYVDHQPHPLILIRALSSAYGRNQWPDVYIHVYGDFTLYSEQWSQLGEKAKKRKIFFICASHKQKQLIGEFLNSKNRFTGVSPFPVNTKIFSFDRDLRNRARARFKFKDDVCNVVYAGRICLQKNVTLALKYTFAAAKRYNIPCHFWVAGEFDDQSTPFFPYKTGPGIYFNYWNKFIKQNGLENKVTYVGNLKHEELSGFYNAGDMFVSLSLYHDEDYGMAAAEALCCGLPSILTDWGGYGDFGASPSGAKLVNVKIEKYGLKVSRVDFDKGFLKNTFIMSSETAKNEISKNACAKYSVKAVSEKLAAVFDKKLKPFSGFNRTVNRLNRLSQERPVFKRGPVKGTFYEKIYRHYT